LKAHIVDTEYRAPDKAVMFSVLFANTPAGNVPVQLLPQEPKRVRAVIMNSDIGGSVRLGSLAQCLSGTASVLIFGDQLEFKSQSALYGQSNGGELVSILDERYE
jgi:hypothetical protein